MADDLWRYWHWVRGRRRPSWQLIASLSLNQSRIDYRRMFEYLFSGDTYVNLHFLFYLILNDFQDVSPIDPTPMGGLCKCLEQE